MALAQTKQNIITDRDIKGRHSVTEKTHHLSSGVHMGTKNQVLSYPKPKDKKSAHRHVEDAFDDSLTSKDIHDKTSKKPKNNDSISQTLSRTETGLKKAHPVASSPHTYPITEKSSSNPIQDNTTTPHYEKKSVIKKTVHSLKSALKSGLISKATHEKAKKIQPHDEKKTMQESVSTKKDDISSKENLIDTKKEATIDNSISDDISGKPKDQENDAKNILKEDISSSAAVSDDSKITPAITPASSSPPSPPDKAQIHDSGPDSHLNTKVDSKKAILHLEKIESHLSEMTANLKDRSEKVTLEKTASDKSTDTVQESSVSTQSGSPITTHIPKEIIELRKKEKDFSSDIEALDRIYKDGLISLDSYEEKKKHIEKKIADIEESILRIFEKEEFDGLKERLETEIKSNFSKGPFRLENNRYHEDIDALTKIRDAGLISKEEYLKKKDELNAKMNKDDEIISKIDVIFEEYKKDLVNKIEEKKKDIDKRVIVDDLPSQSIESEDSATTFHKENPKGIIQKIKALFGLVDDAVAIVRDPMLDKIRKIKREDNPRNALIRCAFILKGVVERKISTDKELTYNELIDKLQESDLDPTTQKSLSDFFKKVSSLEYKDLIDDNELPNLLNEVERLAKLVARIKPPSVVSPLAAVPVDAVDAVDTVVPKLSPPTVIEESGNTPPIEIPKTDDNIQHKSRSVLEKINSFFGV